MRFALYAAPPAQNRLSQAAARWLGRDAWGGAVSPRAPAPGFDAATLDRLTAEPRRYGFHATLKPPFRLAGGATIDGLRSALQAFGASAPAVLVPALDLRRIGPFFALVPEGDLPALQALAAAVVRSFEPFRAPLTEDEVARRRPERLTPRQREHLAAWGYPYVFDEFRFHMTLTGPVPEELRDPMEAVLRERFAAFIGRPLAIDSLALFVEPEPPGNFVVDCAVPLAPSTA